MHLPLPTHLFASAACSGACLTFMAWMSSWVFILYISFLLWVGHCLGMGFLFFNSAHVFFHPLSVDWLVLLPRHNIVSAMILPNFVYWTGLKCLPCQFHVLFLPLVYTAQYSYWVSSYNILGFPGPFYSFGHPRPVPFFKASSAHFVLSFFFFLHSNGLLLNHLDFSFGFIGLQTNPIYQFCSLGSSSPFFDFFLFLMIL